MVAFQGIPKATQLVTWVVALLLLFFPVGENCLKALEVPHQQGVPTQQEAPTGDKIKQSLQQQNFPWYDAPKEELVPTFKERPAKPKELETETTGASGPGISMAGIAQVLVWIFVIFLIALVILGLIWIGLPPPDNTVEVNQMVTTVETNRLEALPETVRGKGDLLSRARELVKAKAFSQAITFFHSWQLVQLDKMGRIELQKGKTNRQYLGELAAAPVEMRKVFWDSTRLFEDAFYGHLPITEEEFIAVWDKLIVFEGKLSMSKGGRV